MLSVLTVNFLDKWVRALEKCLSELAGGALEEVIRKPQRFRLKMIVCPEELEHDPDKKFPEA